MIEVYQGLFVGSEIDERAQRGANGWFFIHACKEPYHRNALGYSGRAAPKTHPEYLIARRPGRLILNLIDADDVAYIPPEIIGAAVAAIHDNLPRGNVLVHCNLGASRSPTIALLYLLRYTALFGGLSYPEAIQRFRADYPPYLPARGMADFARIHWSTYAAGNS